mmetsp:Transcript_32630/g.59841  ORF Transcript_32630/g.59841 Transcript_32630/m.59841 type:complete len:93 (+) Transcript_32630:102-380(+)
MLPVMLCITPINRTPRSMAEHSLKNAKESSNTHLLMLTYASDSVRDEKRLLEGLVCPHHHSTEPSAACYETTGLWNDMYNVRVLGGGTKGLC